MIEEIPVLADVMLSKGLKIGEDDRKELIVRALECFSTLAPNFVVTQSGRNAFDCWAVFPVCRTFNLCDAAYEFFDREKALLAALQAESSPTLNGPQIDSTSDLPFSTITWFIGNSFSSANHRSVGSLSSVNELLQAQPRQMVLSHVIHTTHASCLPFMLRPDGLHFQGRQPRQYYSNRRMCWFAFCPSEGLVGHKLFGDLSRSVYGRVSFKIDITNKP